MSDGRGRGRPSKYAPLLEAIAPEDDWTVIDTNQKTLSAPSGMHARYPLFQFTCQKREDGKFDLLAKFVGERA